MKIKAYRISIVVSCFTLFLLLFACGKEPNDVEPSPTSEAMDMPPTSGNDDEQSDPMDDDTPSPPEDTVSTTELLDSFFAENGGRDSFSPNQLLALETLFFAQEDIEAGRLDEAEQKLTTVFDQMPFSDPAWETISSNTHCAGCTYNFGQPTAYYGLRMLEQTVALGNPEGNETLTMTAVIAPCAEVSRPTLPNYEAETVNLNIAPEILANDGRLLHAATALFRQWVQAITGGLKIDLRIHVLDNCTTVNYTDDGNVIVSYPDAESMIDAVPNSVAADTDFWWVIAPSGVPGNGAGFDRPFITGGMGVYGVGLPVFLSDDAWFIRKPEHLGVGNYHEVEVRTYHPQWFQHEFMHHLYRTWDEFGLETTSHQWFDRTTWPSDFEGQREADYYIESVNKRLLTAATPLAQGLRTSDLVESNLSDLSLVVGSYERKPVENQWHEVEIVLVNDGLRWQNAAGFSWSLQVIDGALWTVEDSPYGQRKIAILLNADQQVESLFFQGEAYDRIE